MQGMAEAHADKTRGSRAGRKGSTTAAGGRRQRKAPSGQAHGDEEEPSSTMPNSIASHRTIPRRAVESRWKLASRGLAAVGGAQI